MRVIENTEERVGTNGAAESIRKNSKTNAPGPMGWRQAAGKRKKTSRTPTAHEHRVSNWRGVPQGSSQGLILRAPLLRDTSVLHRTPP